MKKDTVVIKRKDILKELSVKLGIYENFDINEFMGIVADTILDTDNKEATHYGYKFVVVDDDYVCESYENEYDPAVFSEKL